MPRRRLALATALMLAIALTLTGCSGSPEPMTDAREVLGTIVSTTVYPTASTDAEETEALIKAAYARISKSEPVLNAYASQGWNERRFEVDYVEQPTRIAPTVIDFNTSPYVWRTLPLDVELILGRVDALKVRKFFSPAFYEVSSLYDFEGEGTVPDPELLEYYVAAASTFTLRTNAGGTDASFFSVDGEPPASLPADSPYRQQRAGIDLGGAHKGYALDLALKEYASDQINAGLITAGSTTLTWGDKPDSEPWRIGVEDPRNPETLVATVEAKGKVTVSTSGDYQRYFERDGVRYHHILDPLTGLPARGLQSLTVVGARSGVDSDILSTALFVMGAEKATAYAEENGLGLVLVDDKGQVQIVPGPEDRLWEIIAED